MNKVKMYYDQKRQSSVLSPGDRVLVRNMSGRGGPVKLRSYWEDQIHVVVSRKRESSPVYEVKPECGTERRRILHRNMLMPCDAFPLREPAQRALQRQSHRNSRNRRENANRTETLEDSVSSDEGEYYWAHRLRHHHQQFGEQNVPSPASPGTVHQPELTAGPEQEEFRIETPVEMTMDSITRSYTHKLTEPADLPNAQEELLDTQPHRSQRE